MHTLNTLVEKLESNIPFVYHSNQAVSSSNMGWHIEHSLLTINGIVDALINSNPQDYKWKFNFTRMLVMNMKKIPRGRAKSPDIVIPFIDYNENTLKHHISKTNESISKLAALNKMHYFEHPYFGKLRLDKTIVFLEIHTNHHLEIINDIVKNSSSPIN
jgi:hypothetical protein